MLYKEVAAHSTVNYKNYRYTYAMKYLKVAVIIRSYFSRFVVIIIFSTRIMVLYSPG